VHHECVGALVEQRTDAVRVLLGHRAPTRAFFPNVWDVPGGHCEPGETHDQTLARELQEELGITPTAWRWLGDVRATLPDTGDTVLLHLYEVTAWDGEPAPDAAGEHDKIGWFTIGDACALPLADPAYRVWLRRVRG
jgi:8-oxo-dGTP diphosphatase